MDYGTSELKYYGEKVENKNPGNSSRITSESNTVDGKYTLPLTAINQFLTVGGEWRHDKLSDAVNLTGGTSSKTSASQYALFVEDEWRIFEPLALTTGVRMDDHETYGEHWSPRAYLVYNATDTVTVKGAGRRHLKHLLCCNLALTGRAIPAVAHVRLWVARI